MEHLDRLVFAHRRVLAAACAGLSVLLLAAALQAEGDTHTAVVVRHDLDAGAVLTADDVRVVQLSHAPTGTTTSTADVVGRVLSGPVREGEVLTDRRVVDARDLSGYGIENPSLSTIQVADPTALAPLRVGDRVDVIALDPHDPDGPRTVATEVVVSSLPAETGSAAVGLIAPGDVAAAIATLSLSASLTLVAR